MEKTTWRLLRTPAPIRGSWNMAVDEAIMASVRQGKSLPTLRLYAWNPPTLSLGYAQPISDVNSPALHSLGWGLVRRPTGGRAILHTDELTYSVIAPQSEPRVAGSVLDSYRQLSQALLQALHILGLAVRADKTYALPQGSTKNAPVCFETPSDYEITANGKKLVGSAQARKTSVVLQHGSLPLFGDLTRITQALNFPSAEDQTRAAKRLLDRATTVEQVLNRVVSWNEAADALVQGFQNALHLKFESIGLSEEELTLVDQLEKEKYASPGWTAHL